MEIKYYFNHKNRHLQKFKVKFYQLHYSIKNSQITEPNINNYLYE